MFSENVIFSFSENVIFSLIPGVQKYLPPLLEIPGYATGMKVGI